jgi:hypothetical protein
MGKKARVAPPEAGDSELLYGERRSPFPRDVDRPTADRAANTRETCIGVQGELIAAEAARGAAAIVRIGREETRQSISARQIAATA